MICSKIRAAPFESFHCAGWFRSAFIDGITLDLVSTLRHFYYLFLSKYKHKLFGLKLKKMFFHCHSISLLDSTQRYIVQIFD